jgi:hypothetical protein
MVARLYGALKSILEPIWLLECPPMNIFMSLPPRVRTYKIHHRGLKQFCSVQGKGPPGYEYISRLFDAAMDKNGQILRTSKWLPSRTQIRWNLEPLSPARIYVRYVCHFDASMVDFIGSDPKLKLI